MMKVEPTGKVVSVSLVCETGGGICLVVIYVNWRA